MSNSIFLSHSHVDKPFALRLKQDLEDAGVRVWIDDTEILLGDSLIGEVSAGIEKADFLGVILSPDSVNSEWVKKEVEFALNEEIARKRTKVLPLLYRRCEPPGFLRGRKSVDFTDEKNYTESLQQVLQRLRAVKSDKNSSSVPKYISTQSLSPPNYFTGREKVLSDITETLNTQGKAALCGISGLGKSSVVLKYADENKELYAHIVFIRVDRLGFETNINQTCESLGLTFMPEDKEESKAAKFCLKIEEICENLPDEKRLLLIFDNVDEAERLQKFLPRHDKLNVLLTSNFERVYRLGRQVEIGNLSESDAMLLLYRVATLTDAENLEHLPAEEQATIREIVGLFGFHPLAIFIAGNYINENHKTFDKYLARLQNSQGKILKDERGMDAYQHRDIYSAFDIAFNAICDAGSESNEEQTRIAVARKCMKIASVLAPDNMPEEIFWETAALINPGWQEYLADEDNRDRIYQKLAQYKLFDRDGKAETFTIHRLVKLYFEDKLKDERQTIEKPLAEILAGHFEHFNFTNKEKVERYLSHVGVFLEYLEENKSETKFNLKLENESTANLCNHYARHFELYGQYKKAEIYYELFKDICEKCDDIGQNLTATSYNNLALLYKSQGRYEEAEPLYQKALKIRLKTLGESHPDTATSYNNLAGFYLERGNIELAKPYQQKSLSARLAAFGENHPDVAQSYTWLGAFCVKEEKYKEALDCFYKAREIFLRFLPKEHPNVKNLQTWIDDYENYLPDEAK